MKLYEIEKEIELAYYNATDLDTGVIDETKLANSLGLLGIAKNRKLCDIGCLIKNLKSEAAAIKAEEEVLKSRRKSIENRIESLENYIRNFSDSKERFKDARIEIYYQNRFAVNISIPVSQLNERYRKERIIFEADKATIKNDLELGALVQGCSLKQTLIIK